MRLQLTSSCEELIIKKKNRAGGRGMGARGARSGRGGSGAVHEPPPQPPPLSPGGLHLPPNLGCVPPNPGSVPSPDPGCAPQIQALCSLPCRHPLSCTHRVPPPSPSMPPSKHQRSKPPRTAIACGSSSPFPACHLLELLPRHCQCSVQRSPAARCSLGCLLPPAPCPCSQLVPIAALANPGSFSPITSVTPRCLIRVRVAPDLLKQLLVL